MDIERGRLASQQNSQKSGILAVLGLAYQSFGVVYGDLATSPLYVLRSTYTEDLRNYDIEVVVFGVLSVIFWTLTLIPLIKYVFIVLRADDNGEGGTFALYSLLCRHAKLSLLPNRQAADEEITSYGIPHASSEITRENIGQHSSGMRNLLEKHKRLRVGLLLVVLFGTSMVIGDGILTPSISVLAAVQGLEVAFPKIGDHWTVALACFILVCLFALQRFGTRKVAFMFAPIVLAWLFCIASVGLYNTFYYNPGAFRALSPHYAYRFFKVAGKSGWTALGAIFLCVAGSEAMYADLGHFSQSSIKVAFTTLVYPSLVISYVGQAAYFSREPSKIGTNFFESIPNSVYWPVLVIGTFAAIVASQAVISASFSIVKQCHSLGCFPRVKIIHTSLHMPGQIYIAEVNWILLILSLSVTIGFRNTVTIGHAYGIAVITVMCVSTALTALVIVLVWKKPKILALAFYLVLGIVEGVYLSASATKLPSGGWVPLAMSIVIMLIMCTWHYGTTKKYDFELQNKVSMKWILNLGPGLGIVRVPGMGLIYTELVTGVPSVFSHFVTNLPAFHKVLCFVCIKSVPVPYVAPHERYLVGRTGPREYRMYRCIVRYGYKEIPREDYDFENQLVMNIAEFVQTEEDHTWTPSSSDMSGLERLAMVGFPAQNGMSISISNDEESTYGSTDFSTSTTARSLHALHEYQTDALGRRRRVKFDLSRAEIRSPLVKEELNDLLRAKEAGITYVLGHSHIQAKKTSSILRRFAINFAYDFLRRFCRGPHEQLHIPHLSLIEVGMVYEV